MIHWCFVCAFLTSFQEFTEDRAQFLPPWVLYFSGCEERDRLLAELDSAWTEVFQVSETRKFRREIKIPFEGTFYNSYSVFCLYAVVMHCLLYMQSIWCICTTSYLCVHYSRWVWLVNRWQTRRFRNDARRHLNWWRTPGKGVTAFKEVDQKGSPGVDHLSITAENTELHRTHWKKSARQQTYCLCRYK